jgi:release factor glutamine methyltransferase
MNLVQALAHAHTLGLARLDAQLLLLHTLGQAHNRAWLLAHDTDPLPPAQNEAFFALCQRRAQGQPLAYLTGEKEFFGLSLQITPAVLVPRPDTEALVEWALACGDTLQSAKPAEHTLRVIDLGTGSGAIALALKASRPHWHISGLDASPEALAVAQNNGHRLGLAVAWLQGNWLADLCNAPPDRFDLIVSNPPYIAPGDPHLAALHAEPITALVAPAQGLADISTIIQQAPEHLTPGGYLLMEHGHDQADAVQALMHEQGWGEVSSRCDLAGVRRCTGGRWPR